MRRGVAPESSGSAARIWCVDLHGGGALPDTGNPGARNPSRAARKAVRPGFLLDSIRVAPNDARTRLELAMLNPKTFDELAARIGQAIENSPAKDIEKNVRSMLSSGLARLDVVPRAEFDVQAQVLLKTREKVEALEARLAELEARLAQVAGSR